MREGCGWGWGRGVEGDGDGGGVWDSLGTKLSRKQAGIGN